MYKIRIINILKPSPIFIILALIALFLYNEPLAIQPDPSETAYNSLKVLFANGEWERCIVQSDTFRKQYPSSTYLSSVIYLAAQSALKARLLDRAHLEAQRLRLQFPESKYLDDARMIEAECALLAGQWDEAERLKAWVISFARDKQLCDLARQRKEELKNYLNSLKKEQQSSSVALSSPLTVGIILPITGPESDAAEAFLRGYDWYRRRANLPSPLIWDDMGDPVRAVRLFKSAQREGKVRLIIGGIEAGTAAALAATAQEVKIPFLTTLNADEGLASIGAYAFQGRADYFKCGQALAHWAVEHQGLNRFAMLYPLTKYGKQFAQGFRSFITESGGKILAEDTYYSGTSDFSGPLKSIREKGLRIQWDDSLRVAFETTGSLVLNGGDFTVKDSGPDSLFKVEELSQSFLDSLWNVQKRRLNRWMETTGRDIDSLSIPLRIFDGFLLVTEPDAIEILAAQFARYNFKTQLLGDENWADKETLSKVARYMEGLVYVEPYPPELNDEYYALSNEVSAVKEGTKMNRYHLAGERAARIVAFATKRIGQIGDVRETLSLVRDLPTLSGLVSFVKEERVARNVALIQFRQGEFKFLEW